MFAKWQETPTYLQAGLEPGETPFELSNDSFSSTYTGEKSDWWLIIQTGVDG